MSAHASDKFVYHEPGLQHQFDDMGQQEESVGIGMWFFLAQEIMFFGGLFTAYLVYRSKFPMAFVVDRKSSTAGISLCQWAEEWSVAANRARRRK